MKKLVLAAFATLATTALAADPPKPEATKPAEKAPAAAPGKTEAKPAASAKPEAAAAPAATPPPPSPELAKNLKPMEGKWKCDGTFPESPYGKAHKTKGTFEMKSELNGYFETARYEERKTKENPQPYAMQQVIGFDPSKGMLARTDMDDIGAITHLTSKGWEGDKMVWEGDTMAGPQKMKFKETQTKKNDKEVDVSMEMAGPDGNFTALGDLVCKK